MRRVRSGIVFIPIPRNELSRQIIDCTIDDRSRQRWQLRYPFICHHTPPVRRHNAKIICERIQPKLSQPRDFTQCSESASSHPSDHLNR